MSSRERVIDVIEHRTPDRIPIYGWLRNLEPVISQAFGSLAAFEDHYEFDFAHLFGGPRPYAFPKLDELRAACGSAIDPPSLLDLPMNDPNDESAYNSLRKDLQHHKIERGRFVYVQTPGIFECLNSPFRIENHLCYLMMFEDVLHEIYQRQAQWNKTFAMNCLDLGIDMIHVSDDWGSQNALLFSPEIWWNLIYPYHKVTCDAVKARSGYLSLHSDGNVTEVLDGIVQLGYDVVHPFQESAGMDIQLYLNKYRDSFVLMGGLDVQTTFGFGKYDLLESEICRIITTFKNGGLLLSTSHFVQNHCSIDELVFAYNKICMLTRGYAPEIPNKSHHAMSDSCCSSSTGG